MSLINGIHHVSLKCSGDAEYKIPNSRNFL